MNSFFQKMLSLFTFLFLLSSLSGCGEKSEVSKSQNNQQETTMATKKADGDIAVKKEIQKDALAEAAAKTPDQVVDFSSIKMRKVDGLNKQRKVNGLYADMLGLDYGTTVPATATVNFAENLADMWTRKIDRKKISDASVDHAHTPLAKFLEDPKKMSLKQFITQASSEIALVNKNINWSGVCSAYKLEVVECKMLKTIALDIRGLDIIAYGMTELMPSAEGDLNVKVLDLILQNAGANYVMAIPAMYDKMLSLGLYQFTSYALRDDGKELAGASRVSRHLKEGSRIPGSVIKLRNGENHRAAYLFGIHNFALLCKQTNAKEFTALRLATKRKPGDLVTFMATAHHAPSLAIKSARAWLRKGAKTDLNPHLIDRLKPYGGKTDANLFALEKFAN